ncbi:MAG TPA: hypothetical protein DCO79_05130 [Spirochaeta sp.]|nr:hypothetical protein [Spirochaeta sp.]
MKADLIKVIHTAVESLHGYSAKEISLFHHNDTDGLSSGALLLTALKKTGYEVSMHALEKPYPQILERIFAASGRIIIFADFAGKIAPLISKMNNGKNLVLILDHHPGEDVDDSSVINIDAELYGLKGDRDISASSVCYLFAEVLLNGREWDAAELSHLGVLGAIGDGFLVDGALSGINREILNIACRQGLMRKEHGRSKENYFITLNGEEYPAEAVCAALDIAGGVGYYQDGSELGISICLEGFNPEKWKKIETLKQQKIRIFSRELEIIKSGIHNTDHIQWFNVENRFEPMGVKMIGVFCTEIRDLDILDESRYLAGFQNLPNNVPGFGEMNFNSSKISMRVSSFLTKKIRSGEAPGLNTFLTQATQNIGGFVDACHGLSAATTIKLGEEEPLIREVEKELQKRMS